MGGSSPSASAAIGGAIATGYQRCAGHTSDGGSPVAAPSTPASVLAGSSVRSKDCAGLRVDTGVPDARSRRASAAATQVLPTPVPVPTTTANRPGRVPGQPTGGSSVTIRNCRPDVTRAVQLEPVGSGPGRRRTVPRENGGVEHIGVIDTMFARYDMGAEALDELAQCPGYGERFDAVRSTVPGFKDLAVAAKRLIEAGGCPIVVVLGMPGREPIDKTCAHEASSGIMLAQLMTSTPILEVFVHEDESDDPEVLAAVCRDRARKHARNAYWMIYEPEQLVRRAGQGVRQGFADAGPLVAAAG